VAGLALRGAYSALAAPPGLPRVAVFLPVEGAVYLLAGVAGWAIWRVPDVGWRNRSALTAWSWLMGLSALWTLVFFGLRGVLPALMVALALVAAVGLTLWRFGRLNGAAALLMLPCCGWVGVEFYLNAGFWWLNR